MSEINKISDEQLQVVEQIKKLVKVYTYHEARDIVYRVNIDLSKEAKF